jgi:hypothetical protein
MPAYALLHTPAYSANAWDSQLAPSKWYKSSEGSLSTPSLWIKPSCASTIGTSTQRKRGVMIQRTIKRKGKQQEGITRMWWRTETLQYSYIQRGNMQWISSKWRVQEKKKVEKSIVVASYEAQTLIQPVLQKM